MDWSGTEFQTTPPNPIRLPDRVGQEEVPGLSPLIREGAPVKALAFTGRGLTFVRAGVNIPSHATDVLRDVSKPIPFHGYIRSFSMGCDSGQNYVGAGLSYGSTADTAATSIGAPMVDELPYSARPTGQGVVANAILNFAVGAWWSVPLNYLLPNPGMYLKFLYYNPSGEFVRFSVYAEVLEVVPEI